MNKYLKANQALWDEKTGYHVTSEFYDVPAVIAGKNTLDLIEMDEIAGEVAGKDLLHLQCHFGLDTFSLARLGAKVTGIDFSGEAIRQARKLNEEMRLDCTFVESDVLKLQDNLTGQFDIVYTTYGVLAWLPDLKPWAENIAHFLRPGGTFFIAEIHPFSYVFHDEIEEPVLKAHYPYFSDPKPLEFVPEGTYAVPDAKMQTPVQYEWSHSIGEIISVLTVTGLRIEYLHEFDYTVFQQFPFLEKRGIHYHLPEGLPKVPLLFSLRALKE